MRYIKIRLVHEDECQEMTAHQAETQVLADGSLLIFLYTANIL
jgi:predicted acetyltransferase